jgi:hypothetical protein
VGLQFSYSLVAKFNGFEGPEPRLRGTQTWTNNSKCCGPGTYFPYACEVAVFKYTPTAGGKQDLAIYKPSDDKTPILTVKSIWHSHNLITVPQTNTWAPGLVRFFTQDITTTFNGTTKVGNGLNNFNYGKGGYGLCGLDSWEGPARAVMPGGVIPFGVGSVTPMTVYFQNVPYF